MRCFHNPILPGALISSFPRRILYHPWNLRLAFLSYPESDIHGYDDLPVHVQVGIIFSGHEYAFAFRFRQTAGNCWSFWHSSSSQLIMSSARGTNIFSMYMFPLFLKTSLLPCNQVSAFCELNLRCVATTFDIKPLLRYIISSWLGMYFLRRNTLQLLLE